MMKRYGSISAAVCIFGSKVVDWENDSIGRAGVPRGAPYSGEGVSGIGGAEIAGAGHLHRSMAADARPDENSISSLHTGDVERWVEKSAGPVKVRPTMSRHCRYPARWSN